MTSNPVADLSAALADDRGLAVVYADWQGAIRAWNRGAEALFGHSAAEAVGAPIRLVIPETQRDAHEACYARAGQGPYSGSEAWGPVEGRARSGKLVPLEVFLLPIGNNDASRGGVLALFRARSGEPTPA
jgi:PAS domain S-box-containing protein